MSDIANPNDDTQELRADAGDPNRDRADLLEQAPAQADDAAINAHLEERLEGGDDETEHDAPTAAQ